MPPSSPFQPPSNPFGFDRPGGNVGLPGSFQPVRPEYSKPPAIAPPANLQPGSFGGLDTPEHLPWHFAPDGSHISRWAVVPGEEGTGLLLVRFRSGQAGESRTWVYTFPTLDQATETDRQLKGTLHPYSVILHPMVIKAGVPAAPA